MADLSQYSEREARSLLRRRKRTDWVSCLPCRARKVRCSRSQPCTNCERRGYPELCTFRRNGNTSAEAQARARSSHEVESEIDGSTIVSVGHQESIENDESLTNQHFFGAKSIPAFVRDRGASTTASPMENNAGEAMMPILGLRDAPSAYPFLPAMNESPAQKLREDLFKGLPSDQDIIKLFQCHQAQVHPFVPMIPNLQTFEEKLCTFLEDRSQLTRGPNISDRETQNRIDSLPCSWVGLLYAVMASGVQYSEYPMNERQLKSQHYVRHSFQALRISNFLVRPSSNSVQTLLILGNVLQNNAKPEAAWILLGTTVRMAQSLGFHAKRKTPTSRVASPTPEDRELWFAIVWQDSLLSLSFDRPPITSEVSYEAERSKALTYKDAMHLLCNEVLRAIRQPEQGGQDLVLISNNVARLEDIKSRLAKHLKDTQNCVSVQQRCECFAFGLHAAFFIAWLCRPALQMPESPGSSNGLRRLIAEKCKANLVASMRAFVQLNSISILTSRSWPVTHNALSSAILLGLLGAVRLDPEVRYLNQRIIDILTSLTSSGPPQLDDSGIGLSKSHTRVLAVLKDFQSEASALDSQALEPFTEVPTGINEAHEDQVNLVGNIPNPPSSPARVNFSETQDASTLNLGLDDLEFFDSIFLDQINTGEFQDFTLGDYDYRLL